MTFKKITDECRTAKIPDCILTAKKSEKADTESLEQKTETKEKHREKILTIVFCCAISAIVLAGAIAAIIKRCS